MKIVIVGAGKVGYSLAQRLIQDDHDVYVIDRSPERIHNLENTLDVSLVLGNGSDVQLLNEIDMSDVGMFIAVTDSDEVNMLSCSVAKIKGVPSHNSIWKLTLCTRYRGEHTRSPSIFLPGIYYHNRKYGNL